MTQDIPIATMDKIMNVRPITARFRLCISAETYEELVAKERSIMQAFQKEVIDPWNKKHPEYEVAIEHRMVSAPIPPIPTVQEKYVK